MFVSQASGASLTQMIKCNGSDHAFTLDPIWIRSNEPRLGRLTASSISITEAFFSIAFDQWTKLFERSMYHGGVIDMEKVQIILSVDQKRLQKKIIPGPDQVPHFTHRGRDVSWSGISNDCHVCYAEQRRAGFGTYHPATSPHKSGQKNALIKRHGDFFESGVRAYPESVGVSKFCRLRLRLRLRTKQPTPTDSDSGSGSDSLFIYCKSLWHPIQFGFYATASYIVCHSLKHILPYL